LSDSTAEVAKKIKGMYTDPNHLHIEDPGSIEGNSVFTYLDAFDPDKAELEKMKKHYQKGGLGDGVVKKRLELVLQEFLDPIRKKRAYYEQHPEIAIKMLET
jgi:tryptophanyl-tRNA synthetase